MKAAELLDAAVLAIELTELSGRHAMLQTQVSTSLNNISSQLAAVQSEMQSQSRALHNVELVQASMQAHSSAVERLAKAIDRPATFQRELGGADPCAIVQESTRTS